MGLAGKDTNIGQEKAEALIAAYGTAYAVASARPDDMASKVRGISLQGAKVFLQRIGRMDV